jgi:hypothetical protein
MDMVLIASLPDSHSSCSNPESEKWCHDDKRRTSSAPVARRPPVVVSAIYVLGAGSAPQGAASAEVVDVGSRLGESTMGLLQVSCGMRWCQRS